MKRAEYGSSNTDARIDKTHIQRCDFCHSGVSGIYPVLQEGFPTGGNDKGFEAPCNYKLSRNSMHIIIRKSLLTSLCRREESYPSLAKRGGGRFYGSLCIQL
jgi:hypothetical protein